MSWYYVWSRVTEVTLGVTNPWGLVALVGLAWFVYWGKFRAGWSPLVVSLRCVVWISAVAGLAGVHLRVPLPDQPSTLVALVDRSASISEMGRAWQDRFLYELDRRRGPKDHLGIVVFAGQVRIARWPESGPLAGPVGAAPEPEATDLVAALEAARGILPDSGERKVLLLTDGNETRGNARHLIPVLRGMKVAVYAAIPPRGHDGGTEVAQLVVPKVAPANTMVPVRALLQHRGGEQLATLRLWVNDTLQEMRTIQLRTGTIPIMLQWRGTEPGSYRVRLEVESPGGGYFAPSARKSVNLSLTAPPRVLVVSQHPHSPLLTVARAQDFEVRRVVPDSLRDRAWDWEAYHVVVWEQPTGKVPATVWSALRRYVERGGGLFVVGGETTFGAGQLRSTDLASLLPVTLEPRRPPRPEREPLSLVLLIDRSNSMGYHIHDRLRRSEEESKLSYARRAALSLVAQLRDTDRVGVIAFDSQMYEVAPLAPLAENRGLLEYNVGRLQPGGGTDFYDALKRASAELVRHRARLGHIILLTDGDTNRSASEHEPLLRALEEAGVSVTTIRIGDDTVNLEFLQSISARTGGKFYHVRDASELPQLLLQDTNRLVTQKPRGENLVTVRPGQRSQVLQGIVWDSAPPLVGYAYTRLKPDAELWLRAVQGERADPLLAAWNYGAGRVAAFTAGWNEGAEPWLAWPQGTKLWAQLLRWLMREVSPRDLAVGVEPMEGGSWRVWLESFDAATPDEAVGRLIVGEQGQELRFSRTQEGTLTAIATGAAGSRGELTVLWRPPGRDLEERRFALYFPRENAERSEEVREPNRALLETLTRETGGRLDPLPEEIVTTRARGSETKEKTLEWILLPLAMFAFVGDVAARKLLRP